MKMTRSRESAQLIRAAITKILDGRNWDAPSEGFDRKLDRVILRAELESLTQLAYDLGCVDETERAILEREVKP